MVETSAAVGDLVDDSTLVGAATAGSVFLGNRLRYTEDLDRVPLPEVLVVAMFPERLDAFVGAYRLVYANELHVADCPTCSAYDPTVRVFRRDR